MFISSALSWFYRHIQRTAAQFIISYKKGLGFLCTAIKKNKYFQSSACNRMIHEIVWDSVWPQDRQQYTMTICFLLFIYWHYQCCYSDWSYYIKLIPIDSSSVVPEQHGAFRCHAIQAPLLNYLGASVPRTEIHVQALDVQTHKFGNLVSGFTGLTQSVVHSRKEIISH